MLQPGEVVSCLFTIFCFSGKQYYFVVQSMAETSTLSSYNSLCWFLSVYVFLITDFAIITPTSLSQLGHLLTSTNLDHFWFFKCFPVGPQQSLLGNFQNTFHSLIMAFRTFHLKAYLLVHIVSLVCFFQFALKVLGGSFRKL